MRSTAAAHRPKVLLVDDEDNIVLALYRVLYADNHRYDVLVARTAEIGQRIMAETSIDVLVTDIHLPERSGMDLLCWAAAETPATRVIVMTAFDAGAIKDRAHAFGCLRLMRKPFDVEDMHATIIRALEWRDTFTGNLADLSAMDLIQMFCIARKTTALRFSEGARTGVILIDNGELVHAVWDELVGEQAFFSMMMAKTGLFHTSPLPPDVERTIQGDWQYLLMEGLRRFDEASARGDVEEPPAPGVSFSPFSFPPASVPPESSRITTTSGHAWPAASNGLAALPPFQQRVPVPALPIDGPRAEVSRLIDAGFAALRGGARDDAQRLWEEAHKLDPTNRMIELNLRKLAGAAARDRR